MPRVRGTPRRSQGFHENVAAVFALQTSRVCQPARNRTRYWPMNTAHNPPTAPPCNHLTNRTKMPSRTMPSSVASPPKGPKRCSPWSKPLKTGPQMPARTARTVTRKAIGLLTLRAEEKGRTKIKARPATASQKTKVARSKARAEAVNWPRSSSLTAAAACWAKMVCKAAEGTAPRSMRRRRSAIKVVQSESSMTWPCSATN